MKNFSLSAMIMFCVISAEAQQTISGAAASYTNTAIIPVTKLEEDSYNWWDRHMDVLAVKDSIHPDILLIGDSITHFWGGLPQLKYADGQFKGT